MSNAAPTRCQHLFLEWHWMPSTDCWWLLGPSIWRTVPRWKLALRWSCKGIGHCLEHRELNAFKSSYLFRCRIIFFRICGSHFQVWPPSFTFCFLVFLAQINDHHFIGVQEWTYKRIISKIWLENNPKQNDNALIILASRRSLYRHLLSYSRHEPYFLANFWICKKHDCHRKDE